MTGVDVFLAEVAAAGDLDAAVSCDAVGSVVRVTVAHADAVRGAAVRHGLSVEDVNRYSCYVTGPERANAADAEVSCVEVVVSSMPRRDVAAAYALALSSLEGLVAGVGLTLEEFEAVACAARPADRADRAGSVRLAELLAPVASRLAYAALSHALAGPFGSPVPVMGELETLAALLGDEVAFTGDLSLTCGDFTGSTALSVLGRASLLTTARALAQV